MHKELQKLTTQKVCHEQLTQIKYNDKEWDKKLKNYEAFSVHRTTRGSHSVGGCPTKRPRPGGRQRSIFPAASAGRHTRAGAAGGQRPVPSGGRQFARQQESFNVSFKKCF